MVRHKLDSVSDFSRQGYNLRIRCLGCERVIDANAIIVSLELGKRGASRNIDNLEKPNALQGVGPSLHLCDAAFVQRRPFRHEVQPIGPFCATHRLQAASKAASIVL